MFRPFYVTDDDGQKYLIFRMDCHSDSGLYYSGINLSTKKIHLMWMECSGDTPSYFTFLGFADDADLQAMTIKEPVC